MYVTARKFSWSQVLACYVQEAMRKAVAAGNQDCPVKIKLVAPPAYVLNTQTLDKVTAKCMFFTWFLEIATYLRLDVFSTSTTSMNMQ